VAKKQSLEDEINHFLDRWDYKEQIQFLQDIVPLVELYNVDEDDDWVEKAVGGDIENVRNVRLIRTVYLMSKLAEFHAGKLCMINIEFKNLWKRIEKNEKGDT
jgi:hypothetical protein